MSSSATPDFAARRTFSTGFDLLTEDEYRRGLARAERDLPDPVEYTFRALLVAAVRAAR